MNLIFLCTECSREELNEFERYGVDVTASNIDCSNASGTQKRGNISNSVYLYCSTI